MNAIEYANTTEAIIQPLPAALMPAPDHTADPRAPSPVARDGWGGRVTAQLRPQPGGSGFSRGPTSQAALPSSRLSHETASETGQVFGGAVFCSLDVAQRNPGFCGNPPILLVPARPHQ